MNLRPLFDRIWLNEDLNFLLTNRIPRIALTRFMGWFSQIEQPVIRDASIAVWKHFADLDLSDARKQHFSSLHDCFTRELAPGARVIDEDTGVLVSPCDAIVGACGRVDHTTAFQAKGFPYRLDDLFGSDERSRPFCDGTYVTLRLTASMYHRFHAPDACRVRSVTYISGDTWNVNPISLRRIERLFCRNERVVIQSEMEPGKQPLALVAVAAVLVASVRLHFVDVLLNLDYPGPNEIPCDARFARGAELGWFEHGSTILVFAPAGFALCDGVVEGASIRMGRRLMHRNSS